METMSELITKYEGVLDKHIDRAVLRPILSDLENDVKTLAFSLLEEVIKGIPEPDTLVFEDEYDNNVALAGIEADRENIKKYFDVVRSINVKLMRG